MTVSVTMTQTRLGEDGTLWLSGTAHDATDDFGRYLITYNYATGTLPATPASAPAMLLVSGGVEYLVGADGVTQYPLVFVVGTIEEGAIAGTPNALVAVDSASDTTDHAQILWTVNCTVAGNPDTPDSALASTRFVAYATDAEVYKTACTGGTSSEAFFPRYPALWCIHFALAGGGSYTVAAGNTMTGTQMVLMTFAEADNCVAAEIRLGAARLGTSGYRYRDIIVTPYSAAA